MDKSAKNNKPDMTWFREATFGMFIHWGLYAIPGGTWKGVDVPWVGEWIMRKMKIPIKEYETLARRFNPLRFNARAWVKVAREAGMKYIVITWLIRPFTGRAMDYGLFCFPVLAISWVL